MQRTWNRTAWNDPTPLYSDNPYWSVYENTSADKRNRIYGSAGLTYNFSKKVYLTGKVYGDTYSQEISDHVAIGSASLPAVSYTHLDVYKRQGFRYQKREKSSWLCNSGSKRRNHF